VSQDIDRLQQRLLPLSTTNRTVIRRPCVLSRYIACVESAADKTETHALVDNYYHHFVQLNINIALECDIGLTVTGALQMLLLLLLLMLLLT